MYKSSVFYGFMGGTYFRVVLIFLISPFRVVLIFEGAYFRRNTVCFFFLAFFEKKLGDTLDPTQLITDCERLRSKQKSV